MTVAEPVSASEPQMSLSPMRRAMRRFWRNHLAIFGLAVLVVMVVGCYGSLFWTSQTFDQQNLERVLSSPELSPKMPGQQWYVLGTDRLGRDLLSRFLVGGCISLAVGLSSAAIAVMIGTSVGLIAGYAGGRTDAFLMRFVDILYGLPYILLVILMRVALVPPAIKVLGAFVRSPAEWANVIVLLLGIGSVSWLTMARVVRGQVLSLRDQPFMEAAKALGYSHGIILTRHLLPNLVGPILVYATLIVPQAILSESFLSFLGLGIAPPLPSWGNLTSDGIAALNPVHPHWWLLLWPCLGLSLTLLCLNFVGDGLRDALDPKRG